MKKWLIMLLGAALIAPSAGAQDYWVDHSDLISAADSNATRNDTVYTASFDLRGWRMFRFGLGIKASPLGLDTNFANDSVMAFLQYSPDGIQWSTYKAAGSATGLDTIAFGTNDTLVDAFLKIPADSIPGNWGRFMFQYRDALSEADIVGNTYYRRYVGWVYPKK